MDIELVSNHKISAEQSIALPFLLVRGVEL